MENKNLINTWPEFHVLPSLREVGSFLGRLVSCRETEVMRPDHYPLSDTGAEAFLEEKLLTEDISGACHSELYKLWSERGEDW